MQEGMLSLIQMPRTVIAVEQVRESGLPYIVLLTNPTTGGVTASFAMLGDIHIAEPGALVGFAGRRVIEDTIREELPEDFQRAERMLEHGLIDMVVARRELRDIESSIQLFGDEAVLEVDATFTHRGDWARVVVGGVAPKQRAKSKQKKTNPRKLEAGPNSNAHGKAN